MSQVPSNLEVQYCTNVVYRPCILYTSSFLGFKGKSTISTSVLLKRKLISQQFLNYILLYSSHMNFSTNSSFSRIQQSTPTKLWMWKNNSHSPVFTTVSLSLLLSTPVHKAADRSTIRCNKNDHNFKTFPLISVRPITSELSCLMISRAPDIIPILMWHSLSRFKICPSLHWSASEFLLIREAFSPIKVWHVVWKTF